MKHLIILAHPNSGSLNGQFKTIIENILLVNEHEVKVRDLNQMVFDPVLSLEDMQGQRKGLVKDDVQQEQEHIIWAECITFIYPIWWTGMPAIMKGYIDRVFSYGFAYRYDQGIQKGLLVGKKAIIVNTQGKSQVEYEAMGMDKALSLTSDKGIFEYCGFEITKHFFFDRADRANSEQISQWESALKIIFDNN